MTARTHADLQSALNAGAELEAATYYCNPTLYGPVALQSNTHIRGKGRGASIIKLADGVNPPSPIAFVSHGIIAPLPACGYYKESVTISGLTVDGNRANNTGIVDGLQGPGIRDFHAYDIEVINCSEVGFVHGATFASSGLDHTKNTASAIYAHNNAEGVQTSGASLSDSFAYFNDGVGVRVVALYAGEPLKQPYTQLSGVVCISNQIGFLIENQLGENEYPTSLSGCVARMNTHGCVAQLRQISIMGGSYTNNSINGISVRADNSVIQGAIIKNNGFGVEIFGDRSGSIITGNIITDDRAPAYKTQQYAFYETAISSGGINNIIANNSVVGNVLGAFSTGMVQRGSMYDIRNNKGHNPVGDSYVPVTGSPPYFGFSAGASPETIYITGGDVSNIVRNGSGIPIGNSTNRTIELAPGERLDIAYNVAPSIVRSVH